MNKKMKNCKVCEAEIAKNAKACPHCGAKNGFGGTVKGIALAISSYNNNKLTVLAIE